LIVLLQIWLIERVGVWRKGGVGGCWMTMLMCVGCIDQKDESLRKSTDFRENRIPKFFGYFERVLKGNEAAGKGRYLVGSKITYADTTFWQVVDGLHFAFPKELKAREKEFPLVFGTFYPGIKEEKGIKEYLASERRLPYSMGLYRKYPELDRR